MISSDTYLFSSIAMKLKLSYCTRIKAAPECLDLICLL